MSDLVPSAFLLLKIGVIIGLTLYAAFAWIIVRQEMLMANVLEEGFEPILRMLALIHLVASVGVIFLAFILL